MEAGLEIVQSQGRDGRTMHPNSLANLELGKFARGISGNPGGMPANSPQITRATIKLAAMKSGECFEPQTKGEEIALAWFDAIIAGDMRALQMFLDRTEGPVTQSLSIGPQKSDAEFEAELAAYGVDVSALMRMIASDV
ncbi:MAG: DUF5681 domain-containing protein [Acidobacteriota bacterium]